MAIMLHTPCARRDTSFQADSARVSTAARLTAMPSTATNPANGSVRYSSDWNIDIPKIAECTIQAPVECRIAQSIQERMAAFGLVYDKYLAKGMLQPNPFRMRVIEHHLVRARRTPVFTG